MGSRRKIGKRGLVIGITAVLSSVFLAAGGGFDVLWAANGPTADGARIPNYDIRADRGQAADDLRESARQRSGRNASDAARLRERATAGEAALRRRVASLRIERHPDLDVPEVIGTDVWAPQSTALTPPSKRPRVETLRSFINENRGLFGLSGTADGLRVIADYTNPGGGLSFVRLVQEIGGVPVFGGEAAAGFTPDGRIVRVINNIAPGLDDISLSADPGDASNAVRWAAGHLGLSEPPHDGTGPASLRQTAERMYFAVEPGVAVPAWRVMMLAGGTPYYVVVDAQNGALLWRKNLSEDQTATATFDVYGNTTSPLKTADSPAPYTPGCPDAANCPQPAAVPRTVFTLIGNEGPLAFNNIGWIPDAGLPVRTPANPNITDGNNGEAGIDRDGTQGVDPQGHAVGNPNRVFSYAYNPAPGIPPPGDDPTPPNPQTYPPTPFQQGLTTHGFYLLNRWHDEMYKLGFNEQAGNFQHFNFGRGGTEGDRISFEVQDGTGTNGANFSTPADGGRGVMQNFRWTLATPGRDGTLDSTVVIHELTHGTTSRLHGNTAGLSTNMSRGLGEGWSDFYAAALLSEPSDAPCGIHAVGGYISFNIAAGYANSYYGLRRFPLSRIGCVGQNGLPYDPLTFRHLNAGSCAAFDAAFPRGPLGAAACDQVHNAGEIWSSALWEMRGRLIDIHGAAEGNRRSLQYVTDAMKLSPLNPTFIQARDSIIVAAMFLEWSDVPLIREGFRRRGMGNSASVQGISPAVVVEAFDYAPGTLRSPYDFDGDGRTDISVFRPANGNWHLQQSTQGFTAANWGLATDKLVPADYDNDGKTDLAVFRKGENSTWYILNSSNSTVRAVQWGASNIEQAILFDTPVPADYDGDGRADLAVWRLTDLISEPARFLILQSSNSQARVQQWGLSSDIPVPADHDGDGRADLAIYRGSAPGGGQWWVLKSRSAEVTVTQFGLGDDKPVPADYTGDGKTDVAYFRPSTGQWFVLRSEDLTFYAFPFGTTGDVPVPGDYDGDGKTDAGVYRPTGSTWFVNRSTAGTLIQQFGQSGDVPVPNAFVR